MTECPCPHWEQVSAAADGELTPAAQRQAFRHTRDCAYCGPLLAAIDECLDSPEVEHEPLPLDPSLLNARERRWLGVRWSRWLLAAAAVMIIAEAIPAFATGRGVDAAAHTARHLATWQIGFGVGLLVAAFMSRLTHAMLALAATFATLTLVATLIDVINGHQGPLAELVHLVELVAVALLWHLTPPHLLPWRRPSDRPPDTGRQSEPQHLRLVPSDDPKRPADPG